MGDHIENSVLIIVIFLLIVLFAGDPDLMDALIGLVRGAGQ